MSSKRVLSGLLLAAAVALCASPAALAQQQLGAVQGTVTDATGGVLAGVAVTITHGETGATRATTSNASGVYRLPALEPGRYDIAAEQPGFKRAVRKDVIVSVGATLGVNFRLDAGGVAETVEVTGVAPDIQTEKADVSAVVEQKKINDLPLVARNVFQLAALQPGVVADRGNQTDFLAAEQGLGVNASGLRGSANNATVDGASVNNGPWGGTVLIVPNAEAVQEFRVISNNLSAEYGRNAGAAVTVITKGGTNELRGSVFNFHRDDALRSRNVFETGTKPDYERNDFGGSLGGPILKDRTFFFVSYEGVRQTTGRGQVLTVETEQFVDFVRRTRPNSIAAQLLQRYKPIAYPTTDLRDLGSPAPGANVWGPPDGIPDVGTITVAARGRRRGDQVNARLDHAFNQAGDRLRATFYRTNIRDTGAGLRPAFDNPLPVNIGFFNVAHTHVFSSQALNELSFGYARQHGEAADSTPEVPTIPAITPLSQGFGIPFWHPITFTQQVFEIKDTVTLSRARHSFRIGGEARLSKDFAHLHHWERPNYTFASILDFADDEPFEETRAVNPASGLRTSAPGDYRTKEFGLFVQDNWKVRPNLTLNLGLRYENFGNPGKADGPFSAIVLGPGATRQEQMRDARMTTTDSLYRTDGNNLAPRLGFAWDPSSNGKTSIRGGAGISYNRINNTVWSDERLNPPQFASATTNIFGTVPILYSLGPQYAQNPALGRGLDERGGIRGARVDLRVIDPEIDTPYVYNWFLGAQRQLPARFMVEVNYIGTAGRKLLSGDGPGGENHNRFAGDLLDGRLDRINRSFNVIGLAESRISSSYHGLTVQVQRRYYKGFSFQAAYTLGKAIDYAGVAVEVSRPDLNKGPAGFDVRHRIAANVLWEIPGPSGAAGRRILGGWQLNAISVWESGRPFNITCGLPYPRCDFNADGTNNDRVDTPAFGNIKRGLSNDQFRTGIFTAADFPLPARGTLGNLGRNTFRGPRYFDTDVSLFKNVDLPWFGARNATLQLRVEAFNVFDTVNFDLPSGNVASTVFGRSTSVFPSREVQLGVKFIF